jgi:hypothetical protein
MCNDFKANDKGFFESFDGNYRYEGEWLDDKKHGEGVEFVKNKYEYRG